ncbi:YIP1 family protein [Ktedonobacteria bacterium brp13]|nr:YIP1 family protein [Ktedonobacteria bacterium brp13]
MSLLPRQYWRVLSHPGTTTFAEEQVTASWSAIWVQVISYGIIAIILAVLLRRPIVPISFVLAFAGLFIFAGIFWLIAKAFRGQGHFLQYMYCYLLFFVPLGIIMNLLTPIPVVGVLLTFVVAIYVLVLLIFMTAGVHRMSGGKATLAVLILPVGLALLICIIIAIAFPFLMHTMQNVQNVPIN